MIMPKLGHLALRLPIVALALLVLHADARAPAHAEIDCGTLQGSGIVRVVVGDIVLRVNVECGSRT